MQLSELASHHFGGHPARTLMGARSIGRLYNEIQHETYTEPLAATLFWQIVESSPAYVSALALAGGSPLAATRGEAFVVSHGGRYDLVVFDPGFTSPSPSATTLQLQHSDLWSAWTLWRDRRLYEMAHPAARSLADAEWQQKAMAVINSVEPTLAREIADLMPFGVLVMRPPVVEFSAAPSPPVAVAPAAGAPVSTVGVVAKDALGRTGVTAALHPLSQSGVVVQPGVTNALVNNQAGVIQSADPVSDSCFIQLTPPGVMMSKTRGSKGPLKGVSPRQWGTASFEGIGSGPGIKTTVIGDWSVDLPFVQPYNQLKVLTTPVTAPGDSGAALIDSDDYVIGFAFYRTGLGEPIEFSAWIWAHSVYNAHNLQ